jgi:CheY-like chemotaxis protein
VFVLIVDDNLLSCTRLLGQVQAAGWQAKAVGPGPEGLTLARQHRPDALIVNLAAASRDAALFIQAVKAEPDLAPIPILGFCGHREALRREAALAAGCDRVVSNSAISAGAVPLVEALTARAPRIGQGI